MSQAESSRVPASTAQDLRELRRGVAQAGDAQVLQVVHMVDRLEGRGASDALIQPVRARLRAIGLAHPLRFARLLFLPLDALIVAPALWRPGSPSVPRTAIGALSACIRSAMLASVDGTARLRAIDALIADATTGDLARVRQAGVLLWPLASSLLRQLASASPGGALPDGRAGWLAAGLPAAEFTPLVLSLCPILAQATRLYDHDHANPKLDGEAVQALQAVAVKEGTRAACLMLALLVIRAPEHAEGLLLAANGPGQPRVVAEHAAEAALAWLAAETKDQGSNIIGETNPAELRRQAALLHALLQSAGDAGRRRQLSDLKAHLLESSLRRLETALGDQLAPALRTCPPGAEAEEATLGDMEVTARTLRRFEMEARRIGGGKQWDEIVAKACEQVTGTAWLGRMDHARLVEILAGPEAAIKVLSAPWS